MRRHTPEIGKCGPARRRRRSARKMAAAAAAGLLILAVAGCGADSGQNPATAAESGQLQEQTAAANGADAKTQTDIPQTAQDIYGGKTGDYSDSDLDASWDQAGSTRITCTGSQARIQGQGAEAEDGMITISAEGTYVLEGRFEGQLRVDAGKEDEVRLVFNGFQIDNGQTSPVYGVQSKSILLILADGTENTVSDGAEYVFEAADEDEPDAAIFSKDDLIINGGGSLRVLGNYSNGIRSKDGLKMISGNIEIIAVKDALKGKDFVMVKDGQILIESGEDGIKSNNDKDSEKGYVVIDGGNIQISAGDDGIHAETWLTVNGGAIDIQKSYEGLEGMKVDLNGGDIRIVSSDDGINAAGGSSSDSGAERAKMQNNPELYVRIAGGTIRVDASADGIDSNGNLYVEGGDIYISGPEHSGDGALDYNGEAVISGGTFAAAGSAGMMQTFSQDSTQNMLMVYFDQTQPAGTTLVLKDGGGSILLEYQPEKAYECVLISLPGLEEGSTCLLENGSESQDIKISGTITTVGNMPEGRGGGRQGGGGRGSRPDMGMPPGEEGAPAEGGADDVDGAPAGRGAGGVDGAPARRGAGGEDGAPAERGAGGVDGAPARRGAGGVDGAPARRGVGGEDGAPAGRGAGGED